MSLALSKDQVDTFTQLIEDNPVGWGDEIQDVKSKYPDVFGSITARPEKDLKTLSAEDYMVWQDRIKEYKKAVKPEVSPASFSTGRTINFANPSTNSFFGKTDSTLKNFMGLATNPSISSALDLSGEIAGVSGKISSLSQGFTSQITSGLADKLEGFISGGLASRATQIINMFPPNLYLLALKLAIAMQESAMGHVLKVFDSLECVGDKVNQAMKGVIEDMLVGLVKNSKQMPECASTEFIGAITNKITDKIDDIVGPLVNPLNSIFRLGFNVKDTLSQGISTIENFQNLFKCADKEASSLSKYKIDGGLLDMLDPGQEQALIDKAFAMSNRTSGGSSVLSAFEQAYGLYNIFGASGVGGSSPGGLSECNSTEVPTRCSSPKVDFFGGGGGSGAAGDVVLGKFINKLDKDDIYGGIQKVSSVLGVRITNPGAKYREAPLMAITDECNQGYGAYARAIIDKNMNSPTYGQVIDAVVISEGENYPTNGYQIEDGSSPDPYIGKIIIENPGIGYDIGDFIESISPIDGEIVPSEDYIIEIDPTTGEFINVRLTPLGARKTFSAMPQLNINTSSGNGAILRPVMTTDRNDTIASQEVVEVIDCITQ